MDVWGEVEGNAGDFVGFRGMFCGEKRSKGGRGKRKVEDEQDDRKGKAGKPAKVKGGRSFIKGVENEGVVGG